MITFKYLIDIINEKISVPQKNKIHMYRRKTNIELKVLLYFLINQLKKHNKDMGFDIKRPPNREYLLSICNTLFPWCPLLENDIILS